MSTGSRKNTGWHKKAAVSKNGKNKKKIIDYEDRSLFSDQETGEKVQPEVPGDTSNRDEDIHKLSSHQEAYEHTHQNQNIHEDVSNKISFIISKVVDAFYNISKSSSNYTILSQIDRYEKFFRIITNLKQSLQKAKNNEQLDEFLQDILNKLEID